jgi:hypothetical protein
MMRTSQKLKLNILASVLALAIASQPVAAAAQSAPNSPAPSAPPAGQYAPPPAGSETAGSTYDQRAQQYDRAYADQYSRWAAQNCIDQRNNTVAGAAIGGVLGAVLGSSVAGHGAHAAGAVAGGALGATAGAVIGSNATNACPPGYVVAPGAPAFYDADPAYPVEVVYGPAWYQPWVWVDGRWVYRPYRYWYWTNQAYWRPNWRPGPWRYHYHRW